MASTKVARPFRGEARNGCVRPACLFIINTITIQQRSLCSLLQGRPSSLYEYYEKLYAIFLSMYIRQRPRTEAPRHQMDARWFYIMMAKSAQPLQFLLL